uniref:Putative secreted protein n=1 Tax=Anopheles darlingi TaxID=43151 RepID=A0A2M4DRK9_ANODA
MMMMMMVHHAWFMFSRLVSWSVGMQNEMAAPRVDCQERSRNAINGSERGQSATDRQQGMAVCRIVSRLLSRRFSVG